MGEDNKRKNAETTSTHLISECLNATNRERTNEERTSTHKIERPNATYRETTSAYATNRETTSAYTTSTHNAGD